VVGCSTVIGSCPAWGATPNDRGAPLAFSPDELARLYRLCLDSGGSAATEMGRLVCTKTSVSPAKNPPSDSASETPRRSTQAPSAGDTNKFGIRELEATDVKACRVLGAVVGSNSIFVGPSANVGRRAARASALKATSQLGGNTVVWSEQGVGRNNRFRGIAYFC
jgi:hypothetical protein